MKKPIALIIDFLILLGAGLATGLFIYTQYFNSISLVAGRSSQFSSEIIIYGIFETLPIIFALIPMGIMFYVIRHRKNPRASFATFSILCVLLWFLLFPMSLIFRANVYKTITSIEALEEKQNLSGGYFRNINNVTYYFIEDERNDTANVLNLYDKSNPNAYATNEQIYLFDKYKSSVSSEKFHDPIVKDSMIDFPFHITDIFNSFRLRAISAWSNGILAWLCFCSVGLTLCSLYALIRLSSWKLINSVWILLGTLIILWFNYFYFLPVSSFWRQTVTEFFYSPGKINFFTRNNIELPLLIINCAFGVAFTAIGIVTGATMRHKQ